MSTKNDEIRRKLGWDLIHDTHAMYAEETAVKPVIAKAVEEKDGNCGLDIDELYKIVMGLKQTTN